MVTFFLKTSEYKIKIPILIFLLASCQLNAQNSDKTILDSLKIAANKFSGINKVDCYIVLSEKYNESNIDSSYLYAILALKISEKIKYELGIANAHAQIGGALFYMKDYKNSIKHRITALELFNKLGRKKDESITLVNISTIYLKMGLYDKAFEYNLRFLKINEVLKDTQNISIAYFTNAIINSNLGLLNRSLDLYTKALNLSYKLNDKNFVSLILNNISATYIRLNILDSARYYNNLAYLIADSNKFKYGLAYTTENAGRIYFKENNYKAAIECYLKAIILYKDITFNDVVKSYMSLSSVYLKIGKIDSAKQYLDKAYEIIIKKNDLKDIRDIYKSYSEYYEKIKNPIKALDYYRLYSATNDSILSEISRNKFLDLQINFETEKMRAENEIQALKIKQNRNQRNFSIILFAFMLILAIVIYSRFLLKKKTNRLLSEKNTELESINKIKDKFFAIIAHDLKNQLTAFQNISKTLSDNYQQIADEKKHLLINKINTAANTLYTVLENLLIWSSSQIKGIEFDPKHINLNEIANQVLSELKLTIEKKEILIKNEIPPDISAWADENMVRTIIRNLINNSIKFSNENTEIIITSVNNENMVEVSVTDQGIGISDTDKEKLFNLDVNHKGIGSSKEKGIGLGLIISKTFIEKMRGKIWIKDNQEKGCIFTFSLPINS